MIVNRRSVLSHATWMLLAAAVFVSAGAGCSVTARPGFGSDSSEPFFFLHFGDTQLAAGSGKLAAQKARFAEAVRQANELKPAFVVIAGDLVGARTPPEWAAFDEVLEQFKVPVFLIPGNHDTPDPKTREAYVKKYGKDFYEFTYNNSRFVFLNSEFIRPAFAKLPLAAEQWKFLEDTLDDANKQGNAHIFIVTHCPPYYKLGEIRGGNAYFVWPPADRKRLLALARKHKVEVFACGHLHSTRVVKPRVLGRIGHAILRKTVQRIQRVARHLANVTFPQNGPGTLPLVGVLPDGEFTGQPAGRLGILAGKIAGILGVQLGKPRMGSERRRQATVTVRHAVRAAELNRSNNAFSRRHLSHSLKNITARRKTLTALRAGLWSAPAR